MSDTLIERFGNPNVNDSLARICSESSSKLPVFLIPTINENLRHGGGIKYAALVVAAWCFYSDKGVDQHGKQLKIDDKLKDALHEAAKGTHDDNLSFLKLKPVFGDLASDERFAKVYAEMIDVVYNQSDVSLHMRKFIECESLHRLPECYCRLTAGTTTLIDLLAFRVGNALSLFQMDLANNPCDKGSWQDPL